MSIRCAAKQQSGPVKKRQTSTTTTSTSDAKKKRKKKSVDDDGGQGFKGQFRDEDDRVESSSSSVASSGVSRYTPVPLPNPPAGFVLDNHGRVLMASSKRIVTIVSISFMLLY